VPAAPSCPALTANQQQPTTTFLTLTADAPNLTDSDYQQLRTVLASIPDPRKPRGRRHPLTGLLTAAVAATFAGARHVTAIADWICDLPDTLRTTLGLPAVPHLTTVWRLLNRLDHSAMQTVLDTWLVTRLERTRRPPAAGAPPVVHRAARRVYALDGKVVRGSGSGQDGRPVMLLAVVDQASGVVLSQTPIPDKSSEIAMFSRLLDQVDDLTGVLITADALHAQTAHAEYLHARGAHFLLTIKGNRPSLRAALDALPWDEVPVGHEAVERSHGRLQERRLQAVLVSEGLGFAHAVQAIRVERRSRRVNGKGREHREVVFAVCSLDPEQAQPAELAGWIRSHWVIENRLHWVRDVTLGEDASRVAVGSGPVVMAILRNLVISVLRLAGVVNVARELRRCSRRPGDALAYLTCGNATMQ